MRLELKKIRVEAEKKRKEMKSESLRKGKAIDGFANIIKFLIVPIEEHLQKQEDFIKVLEKAKLDELEAKRNFLLEEYEEGLSGNYNLRDMEQEVFDLLTEKHERNKQDTIEAEKKAEREYIEREEAEAKERDRIKQENELLKKEAAEREKEEAKRAEREQQKREAQEAILAKERKEKERLEAELKAKQEAEEKARLDQEEKERSEREAKEEAERDARLAPDKEKLERFASSITSIPVPEAESEEVKDVIKEAIEMLSDVYSFVKLKSLEL